MIGLSLSFCIKDILAGKMSEWDVSKIVTNTRLVTEEDWKGLLDRYRRVYWKDFDGDAVCELIQRLRALGKIEQPRVANPDYAHTIHAGHWVPDGTEVHGHTSGDMSDSLDWPKISYRHKIAGRDETRFVQYAMDKLPDWAIDVRPEPTDREKNMTVDESAE